MSRNRMRCTSPMLAFAMLAATGPAAAQDTNVTAIDLTAPAAAAYCLAKHPIAVGGNRQTLGPFSGALYTLDGYEIAPPDPAYVGAVRRDFVRLHTAGNNNQMCPDACRAFSATIITPNAPYKGYSLRFLPDAANPQSARASGIGDIGAILKTYLNINKAGADRPGPNEMVAGIWGHPEHSLGSGSAWADYCCCVVRHPRAGE